MKLVKNDEYLIPYTDSDMKELSSVGINLTKLCFNYYPTLQLFFPDTTIIPYSEVENEMLGKLEAFWKKRDKARFSLKRNQIRMTAPATPSNINSLRLIEIKLSSYFYRWGYKATYETIDTNGNCGLKIRYEFDGYPVITLKDGSHNLDFDPAILELGKTRIQISKNGETYSYKVEKRTFLDGWEAVVEETGLRLEDLKTSHFIQTVFELFNRKAIENK
jgi:hypothetical protein